MTALFVALVFAAGAVFGAGTVIALQGWRDWQYRRAARKQARRDAIRKA